MVAGSHPSIMTPISEMSQLFIAILILHAVHVMATNSNATYSLGPPNVKIASKEAVSYNPKPSTLSVNQSDLVSVTEGVSSTGKEHSGGRQGSRRSRKRERKRITRHDCMPNQFLDIGTRTCVNCTTCYPGTYHKSHILCGFGYGSADSCAGCRPGTYQDGVGHSQMNCRQCVECDCNVVKLASCNATHNTVCGPCPPGQYYAIKNVCFDCESEYDSPECATRPKPNSVTPSPTSSSMPSTLPNASLPMSASPGSAVMTAGTSSPVSSRTGILEEVLSSPAPITGLLPRSPSFPPSGKTTKLSDEKTFHVGIIIIVVVAVVLILVIIGIGIGIGIVACVNLHRRRQESERNKTPTPVNLEVEYLIIPPEGSMFSDKFYSL